MNKENKRNFCIEWLQLLVSISIPVGIGIYTVVENNRDLAIATSNRQQDLEIADSRQKDLILHECQKAIGKLIEKHGIELTENSSAAVVARFAALGALGRLDPERRSLLVRLLYEAKLITYRSNNYRAPVSLRSANLTDIDFTSKFQRKVLINLSLEGAILTRANFHESIFHGARFGGAILRNADLSWTHNSPTEDDEMNMIMFDSQTMSFTRADLVSASLSFAAYENANFYYAVMRNANMISLFCSNCLFASVEMTNANLESIVIKNSSFMFAELVNANMYLASFGENTDFYETHMRGVNGVSANFSTCTLTKTKLLDGRFDHASFNGCQFLNTNMHNVSLQYSRIINGVFKSVDLSYSNWRYAYCRRCTFAETNFTSADLFQATFIECDFLNSTLNETQLKQVVLIK